MVEMNQVPDETTAPEMPAEMPAQETPVAPEGDAPAA